MNQGKPLLEKSTLQLKLALQKVVSPQNGNPIEVITTGKISYAKLFLKNGSVYATATGEDTSEILGLIKVTKVPKELTSKNWIKITKIHFNNAEGVFCEAPS